MRLPTLRRSNDSYTKVETAPAADEHADKAVKKWEEKLSAEKSAVEELPFASGSKVSSVRSPRALIAERGIKKNRDSAQVSAMAALLANPGALSLSH
jgi:hypothetical protein